MKDREFLEISDALARAVGDLSGLDVIDIGCGGWHATEALVSLGANATGVDSNSDFLKRARKMGQADYVAGTREDTGQPESAYDIVIFVESLHHAQDRFAAMEEAARIVRLGGRIVVIEPEAPDPIYETARFIDDESPVYADAQHAIAALVASGRATRARPLLYAAKYRVANAQEMLDAMTSFDSRRSLKESDRPAYENAFNEAFRTDDAGGYLPFWQRLDVLNSV